MLPGLSRPVNPRRAGQAHRNPHPLPHIDRAAGPPRPSGRNGQGRADAAMTSRRRNMPSKHENTERIGGPGASHQNRHPDGKAGKNV
jgi:hypothetical protein